MEKLTVENLHSNLKKCCYIGVGDYPTISEGSIRIVQNLIRQIRDELKMKIYEDYVIDDVFNKYLK